MDQGGRTGADELTGCVVELARRRDDVGATDTAYGTHHERRVEHVAHDEWAYVGEALLTVHDAVQVELLGVQECLHRVERQHDRKRRGNHFPTRPEDISECTNPIRRHLQGAWRGVLATHQFGVDRHVASLPTLPILLRATACSGNVDVVQSTRTVSSRRAVVLGAAWTVPAVTVASAAPTYAATGQPDLSTSVAGSFTRADADVILPFVQYHNTGDGPVTAVTYTFTTGTDNYIVELDISGMGAAELVTEGFEIQGLDTPTVSITVPPGSIPVAAGGSFLANIPFTLFFPDPVAGISVQLTLTAVEGGVPYVGPTVGL